MVIIFLIWLSLYLVIAIFDVNSIISPVSGSVIFAITGAWVESFWVDLELKSSFSKSTIWGAGLGGGIITWNSSSSLDSSTDDFSSFFSDFNSNSKKKARESRWKGDIFYFTKKNQ